MHALIKLRIFTIGTIFALTIVACQPAKTHHSKHQLFVFGTLVDISIASKDVNKPQQAVDEISNKFNAMHHQWHAWKPGRLNKINQALRAGKSIKLTEEEADFIQKTIDLSVQSKHLFNPAMGELIHLWGFHADEYPLLTPPPTEAAIKQLVSQHITVENLQLTEQVLSSNNPHVWLDMGGIAKGYAIDVAIDILKAHGLNHAIINAGGDLRIIGNKGESNKPWRVAIQSPSDWSMVAELNLEGDESVFTSGNYQRYKEFEGKRYAHIIDARTGMPVKDIISATVIAENGILADAAATALVVAGDDWPQVAQSMGIDQALIIDDQLNCLATDKMIARLENVSIQCHSVE